MTSSQFDTVRNLLLEIGAEELHHGDCVGSDVDAHRIARDLCLRVVIHPPSNPAQRAFCEASRVYALLPYLERNHRIVDQSDVLIATPDSEGEKRRSGTWATIRYARKHERRVFVVCPHGSVLEGQR